MSVVELGSASEILNFESKKKKKKSVAVVDAVDDSAAQPAATTTSEEPLDFGVKKKKKSLAVSSETSATKKSEVGGDAAVDQLAAELDDELSFTHTKKKKKKKTQAELEADLGATLSGGGVTAGGATPADGVDASAEKENLASMGGFFSYEQLLSRVYDQIGAHNPEHASDQRRRLAIAPPVMARIGTKKTLFVNYASICKSMNRDPAHLTAYILAELGTVGSIDAQGSLLFRGRYTTKHMEPILISYCRQYVLCSTCQSSETELCKGSRLLFLNCRKCGSRVTVKNVTSGFQAVTGKRAALRAKTQ